MDKKLRSPRSELGCTYNFSHYENGASVVTQEPCLNCTCQDSMLMCYLNVCPYVKALGEECTVTKRPGQCCPEVHCPSVPVPVTDYEYETEAASTDYQGCFIDDKFYTEGQRLPVDPLNPCETCYCIRNASACVLQDCVLHIDGCSPVFNARKPTCCPVKYDCSAVEDQQTSTTIAPKGCQHEGTIFSTGESVPNTDKCQSCYCMPNNTVICQSQECQIPLGCTAGELQEGECCPTKFDCPASTTMIPGRDAITEATKSTTTETKSTTSLPELSTRASSIDVELRAITIEPSSREEQARADECDIEGVTYKIGETIKMKDPCLANCTCGPNGLIQCDHITCQEPLQNVSKCKLIKEEGQCCQYYDCPHDEITLAPSINDCSIDGTIYPHNTSVHHEDACLECTCLFNEIVCAKEECVEEEGCVLMKPTKDICCPYICEDEKDEATTTSVPSQGQVAPGTLTTIVPDVDSKDGIMKSMGGPTTIQMASDGSTDATVSSGSEYPSKPSAESSTVSSSKPFTGDMTEGSTEASSKSSTASPGEPSTNVLIDASSTVSSASLTENVSDAATQETSSIISAASTEAEVSEGSTTEVPGPISTPVPSTVFMQGADYTSSEKFSTPPTDAIELTSIMSSTQTSSDTTTGPSSEPSADSSTEVFSEFSTETSSESSTEVSIKASSGATPVTFSESSEEINFVQSTEASTESFTVSEKAAEPSTGEPTKATSISSDVSISLEESIEVPSEDTGTKMGSTSGDADSTDVLDNSSTIALTDQDTKPFTEGLGVASTIADTGVATEATASAAIEPADGVPSTEASSEASYDGTSSKLMAVAATTPSSQDCMVDGKNYSNNSPIPSDNACKICQCVNSEMVCAVEICDEPENGCNLMPATMNECCNYKCEDEDVLSGNPQIESKSSGEQITTTASEALIERSTKRASNASEVSNEALPTEVASTTTAEISTSISTFSPQDSTETSTKSFSANSEGGTTKTDETSPETLTESTMSTVEFSSFTPEEKTSTNTKASAAMSIAEEASTMLPSSEAALELSKGSSEASIFPEGSTDFNGEASIKPVSEETTEISPSAPPMSEAPTEPSTECMLPTLPSITETLLHKTTASEGDEGLFTIPNETLGEASTAMESSTPLEMGNSISEASSKQSSSVSPIEARLGSSTATGSSSITPSSGAPSETSTDTSLQESNTLSADASTETSSEVLAKASSRFSSEGSSEASTEVSTGIFKEKNTTNTSGDVSTEASTELSSERSSSEEATDVSSIPESAIESTTKVFTEESSTQHNTKISSEGSTERSSVGLATTGESAEGSLETSSEAISAPTVSGTEPSNKDCVIDGKIYSNNSPIPSENACRICQCVGSEMVCADEICEDAEEGCMLMAPTEEQCCNYKCKDDTTLETPAIESKSSVNQTVMTPSDDIAELTESTALSMPSTQQAESSFPMKGAAGTSTGTKSSVELNTEMAFSEGTFNPSPGATTKLPSEGSTRPGSEAFMGDEEILTPVSTEGVTISIEGLTEISNKPSSRNTTESEPSTTVEATISPGIEGSSESSTETSTEAFFATTSTPLEEKGSGSSTTTKSSIASTEGSTELSSEAPSQASTELINERSSEASALATTATNGKSLTASIESSSTEASTEDTTEGTIDTNKTLPESPHEMSTIESTEGTSELNSVSADSLTQPSTEAPSEVSTPIISDTIPPDSEPSNDSSTETPTAGSTKTTSEFISLSPTYSATKPVESTTESISETSPDLSIETESTPSISTEISQEAATSLSTMPGSADISDAITDLPEGGCEVNGKTYRNDSPIPSGNACRICECLNSEMVCADEICEEPVEGCVAIAPTDDECCNYECEQDEAVSMNKTQSESKSSYGGMTETADDLSETTEPSSVSTVRSPTEVASSEESTKSSSESPSAAVTSDVSTEGKTESVNLLSAVTEPSTSEASFENSTGSTSLPTGLSIKVTSELSQTSSATAAESSETSTGASAETTTQIQQESTEASTHTSTRVFSDISMSLEGSTATPTNLASTGAEGSTEPSNEDFSTPAESFTDVSLVTSTLGTDVSTEHASATTSEIAAETSSAPEVSTNMLTPTKTEASTESSNSESSHKTFGEPATMKSSGSTTGGPTEEVSESSTEASSVPSIPAMSKTSMEVSSESSAEPTSEASSQPFTKASSGTLTKPSTAFSSEVATAKVQPEMTTGTTIESASDGGITEITSGASSELNTNKTPAGLISAEQPASLEMPTEASIESSTEVSTQTTSGGSATRISVPTDVIEISTVSVPTETPEENRPAVTPKGECTEGVKVYTHNTTVLHEDPCQLCMCMNSEIICSTEICPEPEKGCVQMPKTDHQCCVFQCGDTAIAFTTPDAEPSREDASTAETTPEVTTVEATTEAATSLTSEAISNTAKGVNTEQKAIPTVTSEHPMTVTAETLFFNTTEYDDEEEVTIGPGGQYKSTNN
ncbi:hypothetical protein BIW11_06677 [Tropilaelaps mercedesae]|uniref:VWFC domain-containing protein n=1 Tax=Tropilaelaps mercedesae TaxID=418985 RepID=A0A1V9XX13_9ACAR|nr:hypothetical protein BIW11_06677 [Tropilaelaps mercedesae]